MYLVRFESSIAGFALWKTILGLIHVRFGEWELPFLDFCLPLQCARSCRHCRTCKFLVGKDGKVSW